MAVTERGLKKKEALRESIVAAAKCIVAREGWQAVSIRKIADAIGYSLPVVYNHFESKDAILEEFVLEGFKLLGDTMLAAKNLSTSPEVQLNDMAFAYFNFAFAQRPYYQMMFGLGMPNCERVRQHHEIADFANVLIGSIKALSQATEIDENTMLKFHTYWSILHGLTSIHMANVTDLPNEMQQRVLRDAIEGFIRNINN